MTEPDLLEYCDPQSLRRVKLVIYDSWFSGLKTSINTFWTSEDLYNKITSGCDQQEKHAARIALLVHKL